MSPDSSARAHRSPASTAPVRPRSRARETGHAGHGRRYRRFPLPEWRGGRGAARSGLYL